MYCDYCVFHSITERVVSVTVREGLLHLTWKPIGDAKEYDILFYKYEDEGCQKENGEFYKTVNDTTLQIDIGDIKNLEKFCIQVSNFSIIVPGQITWIVHSSCSTSSEWVYYLVDKAGNVHGLCRQ